ncbi:MAG: hypothetical protein LUE21_01830 [Oscillospiraceae bacterium]|nr:hypothetical protein [Oscillospiraceae bacterium]
MKAAVRYYSRSGNTAALARAIAEGAGVEAVSVDQPAAALEEKADVLFIGGALYAYGLDKRLKEYLASLPAGQAQRAVLFSTALLSRHALDILRQKLTEKGIPVEEETLYVRGKPSEADLKKAADFGKRFAG